MLIIHERLVVAEGVAVMVQRNGFRVPALASDEPEAQRMITEHEDALVILGAGSTSDQGIDGHRLAVWAISVHPKRRLLVLFDDGNLSRFSFMVRAPAMGYLHEDRLASELPDALNALAKNRFYISEAFTALMRNELSLVNAICSRCEQAGLSFRQRQVVHYLIMGLRYRQIGARLHISASTVETHCRRAREALDVESTAALIQALLWPPSANSPE